MLTRLWQVISPLIALAIVAALIYGFYRFIIEAIRVFGLLDRTVEAAIIAACATIVASVITIVLGNAYASRLHNEKANRDKKIPIYERLIGFTFQMFQGSLIGKPVDESDMAQFMLDFNAPFTVWASDGVLAAYVKWRRFTRLRQSSTAFRCGTSRPRRACRSRRARASGPGPRCHTRGIGMPCES